MSFGERGGYDPNAPVNSREAQPTPHRTSETTGDRLTGRLAEIRDNPVVREKTERLGMAALHGAVDSLGYSMEDKKVNKRKLAMTAGTALVNPAGVAARAANGARRGVRNEAIGMGFEAFRERGSDQAPTYVSPSFETRPSDDWGQAPSTERMHIAGTPPELFSTSSVSSAEGWGNMAAQEASRTSQYAPETDWSLSAAPAAERPHDDWGTPSRGAESYESPSIPTQPKKKLFGRGRTRAQSQPQAAAPLADVDNW